MAVTDQAPTNTQAEADFDDAIFGYDADEDLLNSVREEARNRASTTAPAANDGLGLEEEVKVKKARKPLPKLDEERLLSQAGIPKLQRITKTRLRLKGKGHEFSDVRRILNLYQLWLDDLYPKAKFADGIAMIEKLGHTKRMKMLRRTWIDKGKPKDRYEEEPVLSRAEAQLQEESGALSTNVQSQKSAGGNGETRHEGSTSDNEDLGDGLFVKKAAGEMDAFDEDDDLEMLLAESGAYQASAPTNKAADKATSDDVPDDLDELLGEDSAASKPQPTKTSQPLRKDAEDDFADEMDAMGDMW